MGVICKSQSELTPLYSLYILCKNRCFQSGRVTSSSNFLRKFAYGGKIETMCVKMLTLYSYLIASMPECRILGWRSFFLTIVKHFELDFMVIWVSCMLDVSSVGTMRSSLSD